MTDINVLKKELKVADLPLKYQEIAEVTGLDKYIELCELFGGTSLYIPTMKEMSKGLTYAKIIANKDIFPMKELARIYGVSESTVYKLIRKR